MSEYELKAQAVLDKYNVRFSQKCEWDHKGCDWDKEHPFAHNLFICKFYNRATKKSMTVRFWDSIANFQANLQETSAYNVLSCLQKYELGSFEDFCSEFGYDSDSIRANKVYKACVKEYSDIIRVFGKDALEDLQEVC